MCQFAQHSARWCMQTIGAKVLSTRICLVSVYASSLARADSRCREDANVDASCMKRGRLSPKGRKRRGIRARRVRVARERLHARRFFVRQIHEGPHWGSRQSTQYQFSAGTDRMPSHLT